jgi:large-conductance mechanosensitive channel
MAHGGIAILAVAFALAFATFNVATSLAREIVSVVQQQTYDEGSGRSLDFTIADTVISYAELLYYGIALVLLCLALFATWWLTRRTARACPECLSSVPAAASVCRYCTADLSPPPADA